MKVEIQARPRIYVNAFPKAGTHLAALLVGGMGDQAEGPPGAAWFGTFRYHSWSADWMSSRQAVGIIRHQPAGTFMLGHCGYTDMIRNAFDERGTCVLFVYRDLRDVAVSMTYHIESENEKMQHREREYFAGLPTHEARMIAAIEGAGHDPGLIRRWELYASWLDVPWVLPVRYEDILSDPVGQVERAVYYVIKRTSGLYGADPIVPKTEFDRFVNKALKLMDRPKENSLTFRKGVVGEWRHEFTPAVTRAFEQQSGMKWLERLGYV